MPNEHRFPSAIAIVLLGAFSLAAADQEPPSAEPPPFITVQSELDYLAAAKLPLSITMKSAAARQIYDAIGKKAGFRVAYEGLIPEAAPQDISFQNVTVKEILNALGTKFDVSYRVDRPDKLTVIGASRE